MSKFVLKVQLNDTGLVVIAQNSKVTVSAFTRELSTKFMENGAKLDEVDLQRRLEIMELSTHDGYTLRPADILCEVVNSGDKLVALTYGGWLKKNDALIVKEWLCLQASDDKDKVMKWASVGYHGHNKLYVRFGTGYPYSDRIKPKILGLHLFGLSTLVGIPDGKTLVCHAGEGDWRAEAYFVAEGGKVTHVELSVKSGSDMRACIKRLNIKVGNIIEPEGDAITIQQNFEEFDPAQYANKIPANTKSGPEIEVKPKATDAPLAKATGTVPLQISQKSQVTADQSWARDGKFTNFFKIPLKIINAGESRTMVTSVTATYRGKDGEEKMECVVGERGGEQGFSLDGVQTDDVIVTARVEISAPQVDRYRRAHKSLPDPLYIKLNFEDSNGGKSEMTVQYNNPPHDLVTKEYREKNNSSYKMLFWEQCDDTNLDERIFSEVFLHDDQKNLVVCTKSGTSYYFSGASIRSKAAAAAAEKKTELKLEDQSWKDDHGMSVTVSLLVDTEKSQGYAFKFEQKTNTSTKTSYFAVPSLKED